MILAILLLLIYLLQGLWFLRANSQTSDEAVHLTAGYSYLTRQDYRLNPEHPPFIKELCALSVLAAFRLPFQPNEGLWRAAEEWRIGRDFLYGSSVGWSRILYAGRLPNLLLGCFLVLLTGWWSSRIWGAWAGLVALSLATFEPNLIANACLVTTDLGAALFTVLTLYLLWEYAASPSWSLLVGCGVSMGLALASKYSTVVLLGIVGVVIGCDFIFCGRRFPLPEAKARVEKRRKASSSGSGIPGALSVYLLLLLVAALVLPVVYQFQGVSTWWLGLQRVLAHQEGGHQAFFLGEYSTQGWWSYFPVAFLIKTPVGTLALILASLAFFRVGTPLRRRETIFLLLPVILLFLAAAQGRINIGLRHVLPVYPLLMILASRLVTLQLRGKAAKMALVGIPLALTAISSLRVAPHQLAYFNELIGGPEQGPRYLSDSNIDWGQDLAGVKEFMDRTGLAMIYLGYFSNPPPSALGIRYQYIPAYGHLDRPALDVLPEGMRPEILAISVCTLQGVLSSQKDLYAWLWSRKPIGKIGFSIYLYDITGDAAAHLSLAKTYLRAGPQELAEGEIRKALALEPGNEEAARLLSSLSPQR